VNEDQLTKQVVKRARGAGWIVAHFHRLPTQKGGWRTPVAADGKGFPDLVLVRERVMFVELKSEGNSLSPEQRRWIERLHGAAAEIYVWKPRDLESGLVDDLLGWAA
jgi:VRR-NUC domain